ncbi:tautomerase family protein [Streptomyces silvisoli]|uniref:Tautomerase family protein n=1 Tax=Streptomyces silvisoli TaxID=3034235 RepID=A0ABT5ZLP1_9ACTN|nr:tautomerase family protein [Streptomyces silvisoli]MDF3290500.1 tautomerase family protein [Streptomyces silvisoli]
MPFISVRILEKRLNPESEQKLIASLTDAVVETFGAEVREHVWITLEPTPEHRWGIAGKPVGQPPNDPA